jgi:uncharacterized protein YggE
MDELDVDGASPITAGAGCVGDELRGARPAARRRLPKRHTLIAGGVALVVAGAAAGFALPGAPHTARPIRKIVLVSHASTNVQPGAQITVTGAATVHGTPDTVSFSIGVQTTGSTATGALSENNAQVQTLEHALEGNGVTASEMQTSSLDIYTNTDTSGNVTGFSVGDDLDVTMNQVSDAGVALDAAASSVGNNVNLNGISFSISNTSSLLATARADAMNNARTEASQLAAGAGLKLGPVVKVTDQENAEPTYPYGPISFGANAKAASVPLEQGTQPISVQVSVVYTLVG